MNKTYPQSVQVNVLVNVLLIAIHLGDRFSNLLVVALDGRRQKAMDAEDLAFGNSKG